MRYSLEHQEETGRAIAAAAARGFRKKGFAGIGVDGLARGAKVTSGAFYGRFRSKAEAFRGVVAEGLEELRSNIEKLQRSAGPNWIAALAKFYFTQRVTCDLGDSCALPSLSGDVVRADAKTKATFEQGLDNLIATLAKGLPQAEAGDREARAIALVAIFAGGVTVCRAVRDGNRRERLAAVLREAAVGLATGR